MVRWARQCALLTIALQRRRHATRLHGGSRRTQKMRQVQLVLGRRLQGQQAAACVTDACVLGRTRRLRRTSKG
eukprot:4155559-Pleurochrysis_carterae.AAC.1